MPSHTPPRSRKVAHRRPRSEGDPPRQPGMLAAPAQASPFHRKYLRAKTNLSLLVSPPQRMNVVSGDDHGRPYLHPLQQDPRASTPTGSARRQSPRLQPAGPARPPARASPHPPAPPRAPRPPPPPTPPGAQETPRPSHRRPGRTISLAARCRKATHREPAFLPADGGSHGGKRRLSGALQIGRAHV